MVFGHDYFISAAICYFTFSAFHTFNTQRKRNQQSMTCIYSVQPVDIATPTCTADLDTEDDKD